MRYIKRFNESIDNSITFGNIVKYKNSPSERYSESEFIVKVDCEYNEFGKSESVIMYEVKPNITDLEIQEILDNNPPSRRNSEDNWYKLPLVNFIPIKSPKSNLILIR